MNMDNLSTDNVDGTVYSNNDSGNMCSANIHVDLNQIEPINVFRNEYFFLSNLYPCQIRDKKEVWESVEHFYQAAKCIDTVEREKVRAAETGKVARLIGRRVRIQSYWDVNRVKIMEKGLRLKFLRNKKLRQMLKDTDDRELIEHNYWHDTFWGVCTCMRHKKKGENMLGKLLMKIRTEINN